MVIGPSFTCEFKQLSGPKVGVQISGTPNIDAKSNNGSASIQLSTMHNASILQHTTSSSYFTFNRFKRSSVAWVGSHSYTRNTYVFVILYQHLKGDKHVGIFAFGKCSSKTLWTMQDSGNFKNSNMLMIASLFDNRITVSSCLGNRHRR